VFSSSWPWRKGKDTQRPPVRGSKNNKKKRPEGPNHSKVESNKRGDSDSKVEGKKGGTVTKNSKKIRRTGIPGGR